MKKIIVFMTSLLLLFIFISYNTEVMFLNEFDDLKEFLDSELMIPKTSEFRSAKIHRKGFTFGGKFTNNIDEVFLFKVIDLSKRPQHFKYKLNKRSYQMSVLKHNSSIDDEINKKVSEFIEEQDSYFDENQFEISEFKDGKILMMKPDMKSDEYYPFDCYSFDYYIDDFAYIFAPGGIDLGFTESEIMEIVSSLSKDK